MHGNKADEVRTHTARTHSCMHAQAQARTCTPPPPCSCARRSGGNNGILSWTSSPLPTPAHTLPHIYKNNPPNPLVQLCEALKDNKEILSLDLSANLITSQGGWWHRWGGAAATGAWAVPMRRRLQRNAGPGRPAGCARAWRGGKNIKCSEARRGAELCRADRICSIPVS